MSNSTRTTTRTPILLVATATRWYGTARMPRALFHAGFDVTLLTPRNSLAEHSRFVAHVSHLAEGATPQGWLDAFVQAVDTWSPRVVVPCDDLAFRLLAALVVTPPGRMPAQLRSRLALLIRQSLGDPAHYRGSVDKLQLPRAAATLGVRMPACRIVGEIGEALEFAQAHGYPVVVKRNHSSGGDGVEVCADRSRLERALAALTSSGGHDFGEEAAGRVLLQQHIAGRVKAHTSLAWKGELLTGYAGERMAVGPDNKGPITVNRYHHDPTLHATTVRLARGLGITGILVPEFIVEERTGDAYLLEINRRLVGGAHRGSDIGVDHAAALHAALQGAPIPTRARLEDGEEHLSVHFPQEWLRDPHSRWLTECPVDMPWDDPALLEALVVLHREL